MINKYIKVEQGTYRNQDMSGRIFPILKDYQRFAGKEGGFVTVDCSELDGFEGLDKARINVPAITDLTLTTEGAAAYYNEAVFNDSSNIWSGNPSPVQRVNVSGSGKSVSFRYVTNDTNASHSVQGLVVTFGVGDRL